MNRAATLTLNAPLLMLVAALALSTPFTAGAAPAFLDYAQQQTSNLRRKKKTMPQAQNKHKKAARAQIIKKPVPAPHNYKKESPASRRRLHKKISLYSN